MKKRRRLVVSIICILGFILFNFWINSAYYAIHSKGTTPNEVPGILADHLDNVMNGVKNEKFGDYFLQVDGISSIDYNLGKDNEQTLRQSNGGNYSYFYTKKKNKEVYIYHLDKKMNIVDISTMDLETYPVTRVEQKEVKKDLSELVKPLLKRVTKPIINLQWLYDFIFRKH
ncbi:hypothetical protein [Streptococcus thoraltensis]|uniref:hypothetical protein n=1 Tax=Streptococcus thoraltensis TaxID=55085 RepID=UPI001F5694BD|nr:hypothetical protein [Streptococcus thoraltensis]